MASYTQNLDLQKLDGQDLFDETVYNTNLEKTDSAVSGIASALGDTKIVRTSRENYDSTAHSSDTIYFVTEQNGAVRQYLGDTEISGNGGGYTPQEAAVYSAPAPEVIFADIILVTADISNSELWEQGTIYVNTGEYTDSSTGLRLKNPITLENSPNLVTVTAKDVSDSKITWSFVFYDEDSNFISSSTVLGWKSSGELIGTGISETAKYVNILLNRTSGLTSADLKSCILKYDKED